MTIEAEDIPKCSTPGSPFHKQIEGVLSAATRSARESRSRYRSRPRSVEAGKGVGAGRS